LIDKTIRFSIFNTGGQPVHHSAVLISLSLFMACQQSSTVDMDVPMGEIMNQVYSLGSLSTGSTILELNRYISGAFDYLHLYERRETVDLLEEFFADPSRSGDFFLGNINTQMAVWSLTSLTGDPSKHEVANQPLPPNEDRRTNKHLHHLLCIYHLSHASISSPVLVKFPTLDPVKLRIWGGDSDSNCEGSDSDCEESDSNCEESDLDCEKSEYQLPSKAIALFVCKKCQDSKDQLSKAVTQFLLVCCDRSSSSISFLLIH